MHFDKPPKEKPRCTLLTVKKLLEQKKNRETSCANAAAAAAAAAAASTSVGPAHASASAAATRCPRGRDPGQSSAAPDFPGLSSVQQFSVAEPFTCPGASGSYSDMAVSYEQWAPAGVDSMQACYPSVNMGPVYGSAYDLPLTTEYGGQQLSVFGDTISQTYECQRAGPSMSSSWTLMGPGQGGQVFFGSQMDMAKLEEAQMQLSGMDYNQAIGQDEDGDTILHIYTAKGLREYAFAAAKKLMGFGKLDAKEHKGKTALLVAVAANQPEIVQDLLSLQADINACDVNGQTALHLAAHYGYPVVLQAILSNRPAVNLEARNFEGMTPLHCAAISHGATMKALFSCGMPDVALQSKAAEKLSCVQKLLSSGASLISQEIKSNKTVLHLAVKEGNLELVKYLLSAHVPNMKDFVNLKAHGHTALHMAAGLHGNPHQEEILRLLLGRGADPSIRNLENDQAAHLLQSGQQGEQLKIMLKRRNVSSRRRIASLQDLE